MRCLSALVFAASLLPPCAAMAQVEPPADLAAATGFVVDGVAPNDELNVRETAAPGGRLVGRLPNGAVVRNLGCGEFGGNVWCQVDAVDVPGVRGWVAARYLRADDIGGAAPAADPDAAAADPAEPPAANPEETAADPAAADAGAFDATAEIPCARYYGQPMTFCAAGARRGEDGEATVTVVWPDGGQRVILFTNGRADTSDSPDPLSYTREAELNLIRIGKSERFEITDALPFGG
jgi:hypothetical protein